MTRFDLLFDRYGFVDEWRALSDERTGLSFVALSQRFESSICCQYVHTIYSFGPPLWSSGQSFWLQIQRSWVRFRALPDFQRSSGSGTGSAQPREDNLRSYLEEIVTAPV
jgi:hypothetical protein